MRFRTAGILSIVLIGGMFALPHAGRAVANWYLVHPVEIPLHARIFLGISVSAPPSGGPWLSPRSQSCSPSPYSPTEARRRKVTR